LFLYDKKPSKQATNKFSGMFYTEQQIHTNWINDNRRLWKKDNEELKIIIEDIKMSIEEGEFYLKNKDLKIPEEELKLFKFHIKKSILKKKMYSRQIKLNIYCCNDDWENIKIYNIKLQETMAEVLEFYAENESEGDLLIVSETLKENYENLERIVERFKEFYE
jgi:hypothetical protein